MTLADIKNIKKDYGNKSILKNVSFEIKEGETIGLVGLNGAGKTTLAGIVFGSVKPDGGTVRFYREDIKIGYLMQSTSYTINAFNEMTAGEAGTPAFDEFIEVSGRMGLKDVHRWSEGRFSGLSGGERTKLALANMWVTKPDLLILDEPTNHMDFQGVDWLIEQMGKFKGTALVISHDRYFLDNTVKKIVEIENGETVEYEGNYSFYRGEKARIFETRMRSFVVQKKQQERVEEQIEQLKEWSGKAHRESTRVAKENGSLMGAKEYLRVKAKKMDRQVKSKLMRLEKMKAGGMDRPKEEVQVFFELDSADKGGRRIAEVRDISKGYEGVMLFKRSSFCVQRGDRIGLTGPNGCGKTTLIKLLLGIEKPDEGEVWISPSVNVGYMSQDVVELDGEKSTLEILGISNLSRDAKARTMLANMGFDEAMLEKPVDLLSLGERSRIKIAGLILRQCNLIILDEPTNHLDLHSRERLEETLESYNGTIIMASHDRYMLEKLCSKLLVFEDLAVKKLDSGFKGYVEAHEEEKSGQTDRIALENRIAFLIGKLSTIDPADPQYQILDMEFKELIKKKNSL